MAIRELDNALKMARRSIWSRRVIDLKPRIGEDIYYFPSKNGMGPDQSHALGFCACKFSEPIRMLVDNIEAGIRHEEPESVS